MAYSGQKIYEPCFSSSLMNITSFNCMGEKAVYPYDLECVLHCIEACKLENEHCVSGMKM